MRLRNFKGNCLHLDRWSQEVGYFRHDANAEEVCLGLIRLSFHL